MAKTLRFSEPVVLASASPRRRELLSQVCASFEVRPADVDESSVVCRNPARLVKKLSELKARAAAADPENAGKTIIAADTIVYRGRVYGKPHSEKDAVDMLSVLCGRRHSVYTGVTVLSPAGRAVFVVRSRVWLRAMDRAEIKAYVDKYAPYDKAGAYAIQENALVEGYRGSYTNIVGLPMEKLIKILKEMGVTNG